MIKYCKGCGVKLQDNNVLLEGYTNDLRNDFCRRCFKMNNYGEYEFVTKSNSEYIDILNKIGQTRALVLYVVDILSIPNDLKEIRKYIPNNKMILVINKKDVIPKSVKDKKIIDYFKEQDLGFIDIVLISAEKGYGIESLMKLVKKEKTTSNVYVVGSTNTGKSTLINKIIDNYSIEKSSIVISPMPSTTLNEIKIELKDFNLIDTPGLIDPSNIVNTLEVKNLKKIYPHKEIKPKTYQIKKGQSIIIEDFVRIDYVEGERNSFTLFISNDLKVKRIVSKRHDYLKELTLKKIDVKFKEDIVISGLGFIKTMIDGTFNIYINKDVEVFTRKSII